MVIRYDYYTPDNILARLKKLGPNQVTFRKLYYSNEITPQNLWVKNNACKRSTIENINSLITKKGVQLYKLPFGSTVYSLEGMSIVLDNDCMNKQNVDSLKYIILRENGKLYCRWDDPGSLIF